MPMHERTALPDGPRVISARLPGTRALSVAAYVGAGSRQESRELAGIAHFMEHVTFKGTRAFPTTREVSEAIEGIGGTCNAATDRESTVYWVRLPIREAERGFAMLGELTMRPLLRAEDVERERQIIVEEIRSYHDDPSQYVHTVFDQSFFGATPLGWEIAGDEESVLAVDEPAVRGFWGSTYRPANTVVAVAGDIEHSTAVEMVASAFGRGNGPVPGFAPAPSLPHSRFALAHRPGAQAHLCLGVPGLRRDDPDSWTLELLTTVLGDGASSRLFLRIREEAGLAYDVHAYQADFDDCGLLGVYAGVDPDDLEAALEAILAELARIRDEPVPPEELEKAKAYSRGRLELRLEEGRHLCAWLGVQEALHDRVLTLDEAIERIDGVTAEAIHALAGRLIRDESLSLAVVAPARKGLGIERALRLP
jgi:predicted Zn-dependent peptidase